MITLNVNSSLILYIYIYKIIVSQQKDNFIRLVTDIMCL